MRRSAVDTVSTLLEHNSRWLHTWWFVLLKCMPIAFCHTMCLSWQDLTNTKLPWRTPLAGVRWNRSIKWVARKENWRTKIRFHNSNTFEKRTRTKNEDSSRWRTRRMRMIVKHKLFIILNPQTFKYDRQVMNACVDSKLDNLLRKLFSALFLESIFIFLQPPLRLVRVEIFQWLTMEDGDKDLRQFCLFKTNNQTLTECSKLRRDCLKVVAFWTFMNWLVTNLASKRWVTIATSTRASDFKLCDVERQKFQQRSSFLIVFKIFFNCKQSYFIHNLNLKENFLFSLARNFTIFLFHFWNKLFSENFNFLQKRNVEVLKLWKKYFEHFFAFLGLIYKRPAAMEIC